jgi:hypothetical protein
LVTGDIGIVIVMHRTPRTIMHDHASSSGAQRIARRVQRKKRDVTDHAHFCALPPFTSLAVPSISVIMSAPAQTAVSPPAPAHSVDFDETLLQSGSLVLPFQLGDVASLVSLERALVAKRERKSDASTGPSSPLSPEGLQKDAHALETKLLALAAIISEGGGSETEWFEVVQQDDFALYRGLVLMLVRARRSARMR